MEEIAVVLIQIFFEFGLQIFASGLIDRAVIGRNEKGCLMFALHMGLGGGLGWLSTLIWSKLLLPNTALQVANLAFSPLMAGAISTWIVCSVRKTESHSTAFWHGFLFALMFGLARFGFAAR
jgi:hypothetical protein